MSSTHFINITRNNTPPTSTYGPSMPLCSLIPGLLCTFQVRAADLDIQSQYTMAGHQDNHLSQIESKSIQELDWQSTCYFKLDSQMIGRLSFYFSLAWFSQIRRLTKSVEKWFMALLHYKFAFKCIRVIIGRIHLQTCNYGN